MVTPAPTSRPDRDRVLVVEDDEATRSLIHALLTRSDLHVVLAEGGAEAMVRLREEEYGAIVLDLVMPEVNGFDVLRDILRERPRLLSRVVVVSGASPALLTSLDRQSIFALLSKPFEISVLAETVLRCVAMHRRDRSIPRGAGPGLDDDPLDHVRRSTRNRLAGRGDDLRRLLASQPTSDEVVLRSQLRRVVNEIGGLLEHAATTDTNATRAIELARIARTARRIARLAPPDAKEEH